jgi:hypothetical protein
MTAERESRVPVHGDVVIARRPATTVYEISVVPGPPQLTEATYASAVTRARDVAERQKVDVWYSGDHTHVTCISRCREGTAAVGRDDSRSDSGETR